MNFISRIFKRKIFRCNGQRYREPKPLCVQNCKTSLTPAPDDAELAAQALLESMAEGRRKKYDGRNKKKHQPSDITHQPSGVHDAAYYKNLATRIRHAHDEARVRAVRFVAFCEQELLKDDLPMTGDGSLALLETELYKRIDTVEREGGELKARWQHCLAECIVRQMNAQTEREDDDTKFTDAPSGDYQEGGGYE